MLNEVKFSKYVDSGSYVTEVDLGEFLKCEWNCVLLLSVWMWDFPAVSSLPVSVYVNHRPAFGLSPAQVAKAFRALGGREGASQEWTVDRGKLLALLQENGK